MNDLLKSQAVKEIIERANPSPNLADITPEIKQIFGIREPYQLWETLELLKKLWTENQIGLYEEPL